MAREPLMGLTDIAEYLDKSPRWVRREGPGYGVPIFKIGDSIKARKSELDAWIDQQRVY
ncbi:hypothetical protein GCM10010149_87900 [Nonomuraea roseoviolacea subsp. roseoviolacea]|uniref:helix-turn-helix domain-containing protein n=1 Tax=Nonomuraea roseoviolacea TaxID=103837 RepID=UPI0031DD01CD